MKDRYDLKRFLTAQEMTYETALQELRDGEKVSCWMWFIFPQLRCLGRSETADFYGIESEEEARAYYNHPVLGARLTECCEAILEHEDKTALEIFGEIDCKKLRSSMTLFQLVGDSDPVFYQVLEQFFDGEKDKKTLEYLGLA